MEPKQRIAQYEIVSQVGAGGMGEVYRARDTNLEGGTLRDRLQDGSLPPRKATDFGRQIARGLATAHDKGIVHRDQFHAAQATFRG